MNFDFDPLKAFTIIDIDQDGYIDAQEICKFLKLNYLRISPIEADLLIHEYDGNQDANLDFQEFC